MADQPRVMHFHSGAVPDDTFLVSTVDGTDSMSALYRFDLDLVSRNPDVNFTAALSSPAWLGIKSRVRLRDGGSGARVLKFHGMVSTIRQYDRIDEWSRYQLTLVPRIWRLSTDVMTRIFIDRTVPQMIEDILKEEGFSSNDYEFRCAKGQPREFAVQYQESDLDFFSRWLEHEGIFYFFEQSEEREKIVFADSIAGYVPLLGGSRVVPYRPIPGAGDSIAAEDASHWFKDEVISSLTTDQQVIPRKVILKDYNWRKPSQDLKVDADVAEEGMGTVYYYADHYKDTTEGKTLAKTRAEEFKCRQKVFSGKSDHKSFRAGTVFELAGHYRKSFNQEYILTSVHHHAEQTLGLPWSGVAGTTYENEFVSIPKVEVFRPERKTAWPSIHGIMHAKIDGSGDGKYAEIDDMGRYKVLLPFDLSGRSNGKASRFVRMAQPYAGGGMGMHFPLCKGTEVLLSFLDGDPDRPIIVRAVPNPETASPVSGSNHTQNAIQTGGGNKLVLEDGAGSQQIKMASPTQNSHISLGAPDGPGHLSLGSAGNMLTDLGGNNLTQTKGKEDRTVEGSTTWTHVGQAMTGVLAAVTAIVIGKEKLSATKEHVTTTQGTIIIGGKSSRMESVADGLSIECSKSLFLVKSNFTVNANSDVFVTSKRVTVNGTSKVNVKSSSTSATWTPGSWKLDTKPVGFDAQASKLNSKGAATVNATGDLILNGSSIAATAKGDFKVEAGEISLKGSEHKITGGPIEFDAKTIATKDVEIVGGLKVKGTTFVVS
ncbi:MAG: type VI secretion system tip protein TssI/VgrG [Planctomycetota bacterium]